MDLVRREPFYVWGRAYRAIDDAVEKIRDGRQQTLTLQGEEGEDELATQITDALRTHQSDLVALRNRLFEQAQSYGELVLLRPVAGRVICAFNDKVSPNGPRSEGLVFDAKLFEPIKAPATGKVVKAGILGGVGKGGTWGKRVCIETESGKRVWVAHLDAIDVAEGKPVTAGATIIGRAGVTGNALVNQVLLVLESPDGLEYPGLPFRVLDPRAYLFDWRDDDAIYHPEAKVEG